MYYGAAMAAARELAGDHIVIVGGGNSAGQAAIHAARFASKVTIAVRRPDLTATMSSYLINEIEWNPRITVRGLDARRRRRTRRRRPPRPGSSWRTSSPGARERVEARGLFLLMGAAPECGWLPDEVLRDERGFVLTGRDIPREQWSEEVPPGDLATTVPGIFAGGDIRAGSMKRVASATGEGASVVSAVHTWVERRRPPRRRRPDLRAGAAGRPPRGAGWCPGSAAARSIERSWVTSTTAAASIEPVPARASAVPVVCSASIISTPTRVMIARKRL